ncbi:MAG: PKD domain-containing protein [Anaerolineae bacterium]|nr:PKD domain-containing protein [Anaerolineae bacterium]
MLSEHNRSRKATTHISDLALTVAISLVSVMLLVCLARSTSIPVSASSPGVSEYEGRKALLPISATLPFVDDPMREIETDLDRRPFDQINALACPKLVDNAVGWSVEARTGGRPFMGFDDIRVDGVPWTPEPCSPGSSSIPQSELDGHYGAGKGVNRLWFVHRSGDGYPVVLAMTPDGFLNVAGAESPLRMGAAARVGFIGEPFTENDLLQHVDQVHIVAVDDETMVVVYDIHSQAGEGVLEVEMRWIEAAGKPELHFRSAHALRSELAQSHTMLGFAGLNFMRGPTLSGRLSSGTGEGGIEAFHDGRSVYLVHESGAVTRDLLIPPAVTGTVVLEELSTNVRAGSKLVMDQPQDAQAYFSRYPNPPYSERTDLILTLESSTVEPLSVRKAQVAVDLSSANPEASETANVFFAAELPPGEVSEFSYTLALGAEDYEGLYPAQGQGIVFVSGRSGSGTRLYYLPLDENLAPAGAPQPLTDGVIADPQRPALSADGRTVIFDADDYQPVDPDQASHQRIYTLDRLSGAVRRLTVDPYGSSEDWGGRFNGDGSRFATLTSRWGPTYHLNVEETAVGLGAGFGHSLTVASSADWCQIKDEIAFVDHEGLHILDVETRALTDVISDTMTAALRFSPDCERIAYGTASGLYVVNRDGTGNTLAFAGGDPMGLTWVDETHWVVQHAVEGNTDLYLLDILTAEAVRLTTDPAADTEPAFVGAIGPVIRIDAPGDGAQTGSPVRVSGFVGSSGAPSVTVNGIGALVERDRWVAEVTLGVGEHTLSAECTDPGTGLSARDEISVTVEPIPPSGVRIDGPTAGIVSNTYTLTASVDPLTATLPITYVWHAAGRSPVMRSGGLSDSLALDWEALGGQAITVTATNVRGTVTGTHAITLYTPVQASFVASPTEGIAPLTVVLTNTSTGEYTESLWDLGDGVTRTQESLTHTYAAAGMYTVTLTVGNPGGSDSEVKASYISVRSRVYIPLVLKSWRPPVPTFYGYGIQVHGYHKLPESIAAVQDLGMEWLKQQVRWEDIEGTKGDYGWAGLDEIVNRCRAAGIKVLFSVTAAPGWARSGKPGDGPPDDYQDLADFMGAMAAHFRGRVDAYEVWNEQNLKREWEGVPLSAADYVRLLEGAYWAIKAADPEAIVVSGGLTSTGINDGVWAIDDRLYLRQMYDAGLRTYCDAVGIHPYGFANPPEVYYTGGDYDPTRGYDDHPSFFFRNTMEDYYQIMQANDDGVKRLWATEFGWGTVDGMGVDPNPGTEYTRDIDEAQQADYIVRAFQWSRNWGHAGVMTLWNLNFWPVAGTYSEMSKYSIVRYDWSPRPAYSALKHMPK